MTENGIQVRQAFGTFSGPQGFYAVKIETGYEVESMTYRTAAEVHAAIANGTIEWDNE